MVSYRVQVNWRDIASRKGTYQSALVPGNTGLLVGVGVGVSVDLTGLTAKETVQLGADLVATISIDGVALSATGLFRLVGVCEWWWCGGGVVVVNSPGRA